MKNLLEYLPPSMPDTAIIVENNFLQGLRTKRKGDTFQIISNFKEGLSTPFSDEWQQIEEISAPVERMLVALGNPDRASLILPDSIFRMQVVDIDNYPKEESELEKILLWQARRTLGHPVEDLRVRHFILGKEANFAKVWLSAAPKEIFNVFENCFEKFNCHIGFITSPSMVLYELFREKGVFSSLSMTLLISITENSLTFLFVHNGEPLFFRTKEFKGAYASLERISQEIKLTLLYQKEQTGGIPLKKVIYRITAEGVEFPVSEFDEETEIVSIDSLTFLSYEKKMEPSIVLPLLSAMRE
jgi:Tfp pilus assembly PilM family ATPase